MRLKKKDLKIILSHTGKPITSKKLKKFLPPVFIQEQLKLTINKFNKIKYFNHQQTALIIDFLQIEPDDLSELFANNTEETINAPLTTPYNS